MGIENGGSVGIVATAVSRGMATTSSMSAIMDPMLGYIGNVISKDRWLGCDCTIPSVSR